MDLQAQWAWSACCVKFRMPVSQGGLSGWLPGCQGDRQKHGQAVRRLVGKADRRSWDLSGSLPDCQDACQEGCQPAKHLGRWVAGPSRRLSGELPGCQQACRGGCQAARRPVGARGQAVRRPARRAARPSGGPRGQILDTFVSFAVRQRLRDSPEPTET